MLIILWSKDIKKKLPHEKLYFASEIQVFILTLSLTAAGLCPCFLQSFIDEGQLSEIDDTGIITANTLKRSIMLLSTLSYFI